MSVPLVKRKQRLPRAMFTEARVRLTGWYLLILAAIIGVLSFAIYRLLLLAQQAELNAAGLHPHRVLVHAFAHDELILAYQIVAVDVTILLLAALGAYILAGRTLRPIEEAVERQRRFAGAASHELRTPLTALQGNLEVALLSRRSPEEYEEVIREAVQDTERMGELVRSLVALARPDRDAAHLEWAPLDLKEVVPAALDDVRSLAEGKRQTLEEDIAGPLVVAGDASKFRGVCVNLLENAITYTPEGGTIRVVGRSEHGRAVVEVRDTGRGIAAEHLAHLFEPFYQADAARSSSDHVGLGLALASWIVRAYGGHIDVQSQVGVGTVFTVSLPLARKDRTERSR
jgi:signal transduction histidine kinase